jgi:hypothetical protein
VFIGRKNFRREAQGDGKKITISALKESQQAVKVGSTNENDVHRFKKKQNRLD